MTTVRSMSTALFLVAGLLGAGVLPGSAAGPAAAASRVPADGGPQRTFEPWTAATAADENQCVTSARAAGFTRATIVTAVAVALAESNCVASAVHVNTDSWRSKDRGLWQINSYWHPEVSDTCAFDARCNARAAFDISSAGTDWRPWATYNSGIYRSKLAAAQAAVRRLSGTVTVGAWRPAAATFFLRSTNTGGSAELTVPFGQVGDVPLAGDWNGDGTDGIGTWQPSTRTVRLRNSASVGAPELTFGYGTSTDTPIVGDWNGDGVDTIGVYRAATSTFFLRNSNTGGAAETTFAFGAPGDLPVVGDWNGDGTDTIGVFRPSTGRFFLRRANAAGGSDLTIVFGAAGDLPLAGDFNGDGTDTVGLYTPTTRRFALRNTHAGGVNDLSFVYAGAGDRPVMGDWDGL